MRAHPRRIAFGALFAVLGAASGCAGQEEPKPPRPPLGVRSFEDPGADHTEDPVEYDTVPPVGGDHHPVPQTCAFYDDPVPSEHAVHSLEHGAVWITYQDDIDKDDKDRLRELAEEHPKVLVSEWAGDLRTPVIASAWRRQLSLKSASDERLEQFIAAFMNSSNAPEPMAACQGLGGPLE